ncbi:MAG: apolipoprotein N-acyltransferase [Treponema sp.]|nr:apolipoprotein N-acyltransferase [Candidatus Treponema equifaecale]
MFFCSVLFFSLANPGLVFAKGCGFFAWICFVPIFFLTCRLKLKFAFLSGFAFGFISYFLLCWWLSEYGFLSIFFVLFLYGLIFSAVFVLCCLVQKFLHKFDFVLIPLLLVLAEILRSHGFLGFSYGNLGYTQWKNQSVLNFAKAFGVYGISFFIYLFNYFIFELAKCFLKIHSESRRDFRILASFLVLVVFAFTSILFRAENSSASEKQILKIALIQNASSKNSSKIDDYIKDCENLILLTDTALLQNPDVDLIVWPETAVVPDLAYHLSHPDSEQKRVQLTERLCEYFESKSKTFILGNNHRVEKTDRTYWYNSALLVDSKSKIKVDYYNKQHLVPFTEYIPPAFKKGLLKKLMNYVPSDDYDMGNETKLFEIAENTKCGVLICFEDSFPKISVKMKNHGAKFLVNISDDSWAESEACENLHLSMSVLRAVENNVPVVRSTVSGKTCVIDSDGKIIAELDSGSDDFLVSQVEIMGEIQ